MSCAAYFLIGYLNSKRPMTRAMKAGMMEKSDQIIVRTDSSSVMVTKVAPVLGSVLDTRPAQPNRRAMREPEMAPPNFWAIVPLEKIRPVLDVPFFSVA